MVLSQLHELILKFLENTDTSIFLTGKAGTGKTTFLHYIRTNVTKNIAVVAPTAVAAINAGGATLHSFFQIPFGPLVPSSNQNTSTVREPLKQINQEKVRLLRCLRLLIIDEVSMVRADTLDYIDAILRQVRGSVRPFGGVQILMIGDPYQLPPVYQNDWPDLSKFYNSPYFFECLAFAKHPFLTFELTEVYRQTDPVFIDILNAIRHGNPDSEALAKLNAHYQPAFKADKLSDYVTLSTHNKLVNDTNQLRLNELSGEAHIFKAVVSGEFPKEAFPTEEELVLKKGAFVMFIKNDSSGKKQYYNGRTGRISEIEERRILITFLDDGSEFIVSPDTWHNVKYSLSDTEKEINEFSSGSFTQFPLRLAWALTIHKSQGLTFERAIIDVKAAFAHGQTYVALSRCRSLEGIILQGPVRSENIFSDPLVVSFMTKALKEKPDLAVLKKVVLDSDNQILFDLFDFSVFTPSWELSKEVILGNELANSTLHVKIQEADHLLMHEIVRVALNFAKQDLSRFLANSPVWQSESALSRLKKASGYFLLKLNNLIRLVNEVCMQRGSVGLPINFYPILNHFLATANSKRNAFVKLPTASSGKDILDSIIEAELVFQPILQSQNFTTSRKRAILVNSELYDQLVSWRKDVAQQRGLQEYIIVSDTILRTISEKLPRSFTHLSQVKNFGELKTADFGGEILKIVNKYLGESELF